MWREVGARMCGVVKLEQECGMVKLGKECLGSTTITWLGQTAELWMVTSDTG